MKQKHLQFVPRIAESRWLTKNFSIHAMMDLSDGLGADLPRLARASRVGFQHRMENLPLARGAKIDNAISEGEDYELLFAISPRDRAIACSEHGKRNSENCRSLASVACSQSSISKPSTCPVATFISNSPAETEAVGRRLAEDAEVGSVLALQRRTGKRQNSIHQRLRGRTWEATLPFPALRLRLCTNIEVGVCLFIISDFFRAGEIASPSRGLASMIIFLATEFR